MICLFTSIALVPKVSVGLNQKLSVPKDSYVLDYFTALEDYLSVGVPVYFVVKKGVSCYILCLRLLDYSKMNSQSGSKLWV